MQNWTSNKTHWANALVNIHDIYCRYSGFFLMFKGCYVIIPNTILYERLESHPLYLCFASKEPACPLIFKVLLSNNTAGFLKVFQFF